MERDQIEPLKRGLANAKWGDMAEIARQMQLSGTACPECHVFTVS